jgi:outer membrane cobalamin receptor
MRLPRSRFCLVAVGLLSTTQLAACHQQSAEQAAANSSLNVITQEQIDSTSATSVYDLIVRLHADYLKDRGVISIKTNTRERAVVFLNDQEYGIPETLRNIPPRRFSEIRYYRGTDAVTRFGAQYGGGIIQLISRGQ